MTRAAVLLALLPHAAAWVNYYASELDPVSLIYRWDSPSEFSSDAGLGSGLTWAAQDDFCSKLLPRFYAETQFNLVECEDLMDSIVRGFSTWSTNHRRVTFYDLTSECKDYSPAYVPASGEDPPASFDDECPRLEISITAGGPLDHDHGHDHMAAVVYNMPADRRTWKTHTRSTAGYVYANSRAIELSRMHFNTENCWRAPRRHPSLRSLTPPSYPSPTARPPQVPRQLLLLGIPHHGRKHRRRRAVRNLHLRALCGARRVITITAASTTTITPTTTTATWRARAHVLCPSSLRCSSRSRISSAWSS